MLGAILIAVDQDVRLRAAQPSDYDVIVTVMDDWFGGRQVRMALPRLFLDHFHQTSLVGERGNSLVAFLVGFLSPSLPEVAYIHFVGVDPRFRGHGLARRLYRKFFTLAQADSRSTVRAITSRRTTNRSRSTLRWGLPSPSRSRTTTARRLIGFSSPAASSHPIRRSRRSDASWTSPVAGRGRRP